VTINYFGIRCATRCGIINNSKTGAGNVHRKEISDQQPHRNQEGQSDQG
jgi:hypothetical protein